MKKVLGVLVALLGAILLVVAIVIFGVLFNKPPTLAWIAFAAFLIGGIATVYGGIRLCGQPVVFKLNGSKVEDHGGLIANTTVPLDVGDIAYTYHFRPETKGKHGHPSLLTITVADSWGFYFVARQRGSFDSFGVRIGLSIPLATEDESFNQQVYIETDHPRALEMFFAKAGNRQAVLDTLNLGFDKVTCSPTGMSAEWTRYQPDIKDTLPLGEETAVRLAFLSQGGTGIQTLEINTMEPVAAGPQAFFKTGLSTLLVGVIAVSLVVLLVVAFHPPEPLRYFDLFSLSMKWLIILFPSYLILTFYFLRGRTTSHKDWAVCAILGLLVQIGYIPWTLHLVNIWADSSPETTFQGGVLSKHTQNNKNKVNYYVLIPSRTNPASKHEFQVTPNVYQSCDPGTPFKLVTHSGYLGMEWVKTFEVGVPVKQRKIKKL